MLSSITVLKKKGVLSAIWHILLSQNSGWRHVNHEFKVNLNYTNMLSENKPKKRHKWERETELYLIRGGGKGHSQLVSENRNWLLVRCPLFSVCQPALVKKYASHACFLLLAVFSGILPQYAVLILLILLHSSSDLFHPSVWPPGWWTENMSTV